MARWLNKLLGGNKANAAGWQGKSRSAIRKARVEKETGNDRQIICNNGACPDVSFFVSKDVTSGRCPRCNTPWRV